MPHSASRPPSTPGHATLTVQTTRAAPAPSYPSILVTSNPHLHPTPSFISPLKPRPLPAAPSPAHRGIPGAWRHSSREDGSGMARVRVHPDRPDIVAILRCRCQAEASSLAGIVVVARKPGRQLMLISIRTHRNLCRARPPPPLGRATRRRRERGLGREGASMVGCKAGRQRQRWNARTASISPPHALSLYLMLHLSSWSARTNLNPSRPST